MPESMPESQKRSGVARKFTLLNSTKRTPFLKIDQTLLDNASKQTETQMANEQNKDDGNDKPTTLDDLKQRSNAKPA